MGIQEFPTPNTGLGVPNLALPLPVSDGSVILDRCVYVTQDIAGHQAKYCKVTHLGFRISLPLHISVSSH